MFVFLQAGWEEWPIRREAKLQNQIVTVAMLISKIGNRSVTEILRDFLVCNVRGPMVVNLCALFLFGFTVVLVRSSQNSK